MDVLMCELTRWGLKHGSDALHKDTLNILHFFVNYTSRKVKNKKQIT